MAPQESTRPPDFVAVGHLTVDETPAGLRPGGSALYAGLFAHRQGLRVGLFTSYGPDFPFEVLPPGVEVVAVPAAATPRFAIDYGPRGRSLALRARAAPKFFANPLVNRVQNSLELAITLAGADHKVIGDRV